MGCKRTSGVSTSTARSGGGATPGGKTPDGVSVSTSRGKRSTNPSALRVVPGEIRNSSGRGGALWNMVAAAREIIGVQKCVQKRAAQRYQQPKATSSRCIERIRPSRADAQETQLGHTSSLCPHAKSNMSGRHTRCAGNGRVDGKEGDLRQEGLWS